MEKPVQILSFNRVKSNSTFTISVHHGDGTVTPLYEVLASNLEPNLTISRLQSVYAPPQQLPPIPSQHSYGYAPPAQPSPYPFQQQQPHQYQTTYFPQQYQPQQPLQPQPQQYHPYQMPTPPQQTRTPIGTVTLSSSMSSKITFSVHNQTDLKLKRPDLFSSAHQFTHPRYGTLSWKESDLHDKKYKLLDSNKNVLARFDKYKPAGQTTISSFWQSSKHGKSWAFSIYVNADPEFLDWIMVTGLGVVEYRITSDRAWGEALVEGIDSGV
ncbi:hypothetical protein PEBR_12503 [Penicillium brasilianum]|uniref:Uncharacterized protein n=1 Tax=Penicillium brasilianum TaxID=104259 RepID=A0A1S9RSL1_PENBI|nr:hypothetical protein PEBR_12503 [Penicillium brasilianum]